MLLFACMNLWKERENMCEMFGLLSSFSPGLPRQGTVGGRAWKSWRTTSTSAAALPVGTKPLAAQELWHISFNDQMWHDLCVKLVMNWEVLVPGGESADPQRVCTSVKAGTALVFFLCFIRLWPSEGHFPGKSSQCGLMKIQAPRWQSGLFIFFSIIIKSICALSLLWFSTAGRHDAVKESLR